MIRLDHTIVPTKDKIGSAKFFAEILGLSVTAGPCVRHWLGAGGGAAERPARRTSAT